MIVDNPRRAIEGEGVGPQHFPTLPVKSVAWTTDDAGNLALDVRFADGYTPTAAEQAEVVAVCQSVSANERVVRERAEQGLDGLRKIAGSTGTLTPIQLSDAARLMARVLIALARLVLRRLDGTD